MDVELRPHTFFSFPFAHMSIFVVRAYRAWSRDFLGGTDHSVSIRPFLSSIFSGVDELRALEGDPILLLLLPQPKDSLVETPVMEFTPLSCQRSYNTPALSL